MIKLLITMLLNIIFISTVLSKDITVVILGAMPSEWEEEDFGQTAFNLTRAAEKRGEEVIIAAPFEMNFINGNRSKRSYFELEDLSDVKKLMRKVKKITNPGDKINLLLYGHGYPTTNEKNYNKTKIQLGSERVKMDSLIGVINKTLPKNRAIKAIAPFCFSGSIHLLSHSRKNSCSAAASDFRTPSEGESSCFWGSCQAISSYGMSISNLTKDNPSISLSQAHELISEKDHLNNRRGQLSSIDYIERIFKVGPYKVQKNWFERVFSDYPDETLDKNYTAKTCSDFKGPEFLDQEHFQKLISDTGNIIQELSLENAFDERVPEFVVLEMEKNLERYQKNFSDESSELGQLHLNVVYNVQEYNKKIKENGFTDWEETKFINDLKDELNQKTNEVLRYHLYKERINLINLLYLKGSKSQIDKFENLVMCETSS